MAYSSKQRRQYRKEIQGILHPSVKDKNLMDNGNYFAKQYETAQKKYKAYLKDVQLEKNFFNLLQFTVMVGIGITAAYLMPPLLIIPVGYISYRIFKNKPSKKSPIFEMLEEKFDTYKTNEIYKHLLANRITFLKEDIQRKNEILTFIDENQKELEQKKTKLETTSGFKLKYLYKSKASRIEDLYSEVNGQAEAKKAVQGHLKAYNGQLTAIREKILSAQKKSETLVLQLENEMLNPSLGIYHSKKDIWSLFKKTRSTFGDGIANKAQKELTERILNEAYTAERQRTLVKEQNLARTNKAEALNQERAPSHLNIAHTPPQLKKTRRPVTQMEYRTLDDRRALRGKRP